MKSIFIYAVCAGVNISCLTARDKDWFERRMNDLDAATKVENVPERIAALGEFMSIGSRGWMDSEQKQIYEKAQAALLAIPGHAKYYQGKIEAMREEVLANSKKPEEEITKMQDEGVRPVNEWKYERYCVDAFRVLAQLPSPEGVAVLGFYLNDPVGRDGRTLLGGKRSKPGDDFLPRPINAEGAAIAIRKLGIEHPPFPPYDDGGVWRVREGEVDAWKDWWNEVKAGKRTYRFIGSTVEYGPDGPANQDATQRTEHKNKRDEERAAGRTKAASAKAETTSAISSNTRPSFIAAIVAACALLFATVWYLLRGKKVVRK